MKSLYDEDTAQVKVENQLSTASKKGEPLFNIYGEWIIQQTDGKVESWLEGGGDICNLRYIDDTIELAVSHEELSECWTEWNE